MAEKKMQVGSFHHQMTTVKNMDEAIHLYCDVLGLELTSRLIVPNDVLPETVGSQEVWGAEIDHVWEIATLDNGRGAPIELCHPIYPAVIQQGNTEATPVTGTTDYGFTGHTEQGFAVEGIDAWYDWIVENGYRPQSKPWEAAPGCYTFVFYDKEGNIIQLYEDPAHPAIPGWTSVPGMPKGDFRSPQQKALAEKSYK